MKVKWDRLSDRGGASKFEGRRSMHRAKDQGSAQNVEKVVSNGALRLALQRCEAGRLALLLGILGATLALVLVRYLVGGRAAGGQTAVLAVGLVVAAGVYAGGLLAVVRRATAGGRTLATWVWAASVVVECSIPTAAILVLAKSGRVTPLEALSAPVVLMYGAIITLSIVRMRPWLCVLAGFVAAAEHAGLTVYIASAVTPSVDWAAYPYLFSYGVNLIIMGVPRLWSRGRRAAISCRPCGRRRRSGNWTGCIMSWVWHGRFKGGCCRWRRRGAGV